MRFWCGPMEVEIDAAGTVYAGNGLNRFRRDRRVTPAAERSAFIELSELAREVPVLVVSYAPLKAGAR